MICPFCNEEMISKISWLFSCRNKCQYSEILNQNLRIQSLVLKLDKNHYIQILSETNSTSPRTLIVKLNKSKTRVQSQYILDKVIFDFSTDKKILLQKIKKYMIYL